MTGIQVRSARNWEEVRQTAVAAGRTFPGREPTGEFFPARTMRAPSLPLENTLMLYDEGTLVSALQAYERQMIVDGAPVWIAALGNVFTIPKYQGEGYGRRLLEEAREFFAEKRYVASILLSEKWDFYEPSGWQVLPYTERVYAEPMPIKSDQRGSLVEFDIDDHFDDLQRLYDQTLGKKEGHLVRTEPIWRHWILDLEKEVVSPDQIRLYRSSGTFEGYLVFDDSEPVTCQEIGYTGDDSDEFLHAVWNFLCHRSDRTLAWAPSAVQSLSDEIAASGNTFDRHEKRMCLISLHDDDPLGPHEAEWSTEALVRHLTDGGDWYWSPADNF